MNGAHRSASQDEGIPILRFDQAAMLPQARSFKYKMLGWECPEAIVSGSVNNDEKQGEDIGCNQIGRNDLKSFALLRRKSLLFVKLSHDDACGACASRQVAGRYSNFGYPEVLKRALRGQPETGGEKPEITK